MVCRSRSLLLSSSAATITRSGLNTSGYTEPSIGWGLGISTFPSISSRRSERTPPTGFEYFQGSQVRLDGLAGLRGMGVNFHEEKAVVVVANINWDARWWCMMSHCRTKVLPGAYTHTHTHKKHCDRCAFKIRHRKPDVEHLASLHLYIRSTVQEKKPQGQNHLMPKVNILRPIIRARLALIR